MIDYSIDINDIWQYTEVGLNIRAMVIVLPIHRSNVQTSYPDEKAGGFTYNDSALDRLIYNLCLNHNEFIAILICVIFNFESDFANLLHFKKWGGFAKHPLQSQ